MNGGSSCIIWVFLEVDTEVDLGEKDKRHSSVQQGKASDMLDERKLIIKHEGVRKAGFLKRTLHQNANRETSLPVHQGAVNERVSVRAASSGAAISDVALHLCLGDV